MMKKLLLLLVMVAPALLTGQIKYETLKSQKGGEERRIKIQLPRNYEQNSDKSYPVMVVLDGEYLFEPVAGNVDYYSYWEDSPEMIVVGVMHDNKRYDDAYYDPDRTFLPIDTGADFFEFLGMELLAHIDKNYRTANFKVIVGHDYTANFINYYLLKEDPIFDGYINLSPDLAPQMTERIAGALANQSRKKYYYMATGSDDISDLKEKILKCDGELKKINSDKLAYTFDNFPNATHYSLVGKAIPSALESMFEVYRPITTKEYNDVLMQTSISSVDYLNEKYSNINNLFGVKKKIRLNDFMAVNKAIEKTRRWDEYKALSKMAYEHYPGTMLGIYFEARYEEETGNPKKAMRTYQNAYGQQKIGFLDTDFMLARADAIKKDFGY